MPFQHSPAGGQGNLIVTSLQSPNFVHNVSGWQVTRAGNAEFNSGTFRGVIVGGQLFLYNGTPGPGNPPIASVTTATTDPFGQPVKKDITAYGTGGSASFVQLLPGNPASVIAATGDSAESVPGSIYTKTVGAGTTRQLVTQAVAPVVTGEPAGATGNLRLSSYSPDLTQVPGASIGASDGTNSASVTVQPTLITAAGIFTFLNLWTLIPPSADTSGATDHANITAALAAGDAVQLLPGTYYTNAVIEFPGGAVIRGASPQVTIIRATAAMNAVLASTGWNGSVNTTSQTPVHLSGFRADANGNATYGIVSQNFWSYFTDLECTNATGDGFRLDAFGANGITVFGAAVTAVENHITNCQFRLNGKAGFRSNDQIAHQHFTDGWLTDCVFQGPGSSGTVALCQVDVLAGWKVEGNHLYGAAVNAMSGQRMFNTRVIGNYIEPWGTSATAGGYAGMSFDGIADNGFGGSVIANNVLNIDATSPGNAGSTIDGIFCRVTTGNTGELTVSLNMVSNPEPVSAVYKAAFDLQTQAAATTLNVATTGNVAGSGWTAGVLLTPNGGTINHTTGI